LYSLLSLINSISKLATKEENLFLSSSRRITVSFSAPNLGYFAIREAPIAAETPK
jgi:hypothetical protein